MNAQQFSSSGVAFTYRPAAAVSSVWPSHGVSEGGTPVTVLGSGFSSAAESLGALLCRFNATTAPAVYVSESVLLCNTSHTGSGFVPVEVTTNGREYTADGVQFEFTSVAMRALQPWSGPELGGTVATIDVSGSGKHNVSLYLVDWDRQGRRVAVELREYDNLQLAAPTQYVSNFTEGVYMTWEATLPARLRLFQVAGPLPNNNALLVFSALFFGGRLGGERPPRCAMAWAGADAASHEAASLARAGPVAGPLAAKAQEIGSAPAAMDSFRAAPVAGRARAPARPSERAGR